MNMLSHIRLDHLQSFGKKRLIQLICKKQIITNMIKMIDNICQVSNLCLKEKQGQTIARRANGETYNNHT